MKTRLREVRARRWGQLLLREVSRSFPGLAERVTLVHIRLPRGGEHACVRHRRTEELVFVTRGSARGEIGRRRVSLSSGDLLRIPPGTWHRFVAGASGVEALSLFWPPLDPHEPDVEARR